MKTIFFMVLSFLFVACEKTSIDVAKEAKLKNYANIALKDAIENSDICQNVKYVDNSRDGLKLVSVICEEKKERVASRYDEKMKMIKTNLKNIKSKYDINMTTELNKFKQFAEKNIGNANVLSDYEIKEAAQKYCIRNKDLITQFATNYICDNKEFSNYLSKKAFGDFDEPKYFYGASNYLQNIAALLGKDLILESLPDGMLSVPRQVSKISYQMDFLVNVDKELVIQDTYIILDGEKYEALGIIDQFYK